MKSLQVAGGWGWVLQAEGLSKRKPVLLALEVLGSCPLRGGAWGARVSFHLRSEGDSSLFHFLLMHNRHVLCP